MHKVDLTPMHSNYQALLDLASSAFYADKRVRAMWLHGAVARKEHDAGSDLDIILAISDKYFDAFADESATWWAMITPTVSRREIPNMRGSYFGLTPTCERIDILLERVSALPKSSITRRITIFDHDELTKHIPEAFDRPTDAATLRYYIEEILRQVANFPVVLIREDWLLGVVAVQQIHFLLYQLFAESNKPSPPTGPKQWSYKLTSHQQQILEALPVPQPEKDSIVAARRAALRLFNEYGPQIARKHDVAWPDDLGAAVHRYMKQAEIDLSVSDLAW